METIANHMFQRPKSKGAGDLAELRLVIDVISMDAPDWLCFLVSKTELNGFLIRSGTGDVYKLLGISPEVIDDVRRVKELRVMEWDEKGNFLRECSVPSVTADEPGIFDRLRSAGRSAKMEASILKTFFAAVLGKND